jgi:hypothetical protein
MSNEQYPPSSPDSPDSPPRSARHDRLNGFDNEAGRPLLGNGNEDVGEDDDSTAAGEDK